VNTTRIALVMQAQHLLLGQSLRIGLLRIRDVILLLGCLRMSKVEMRSAQQGC